MADHPIAAVSEATSNRTGDPAAGPPDTVALDELTAELREALAPGIQLLDKLGEGGMGTVFLARDPALRRYVVVKLLSPDLARDERARARFAREAEAAAAVAHPNVVAIYHVGQLPRSGTSYIVMQHIDGPTLEAAFPAGTVAPAARARRIVGEVAQALAAAHARGLVHRDIKPSNVMLDRDSGRAVVLDFGISAAIRTETGAPAATRLTVEGSSIGTPQYMSPEQAVGEQVTDRSDVYSLGLVAFELAGGQPVFDEKTPMALIAAHINREPPSLASVRPDLDPAFAALVDRCLMKEPARRPAAAEVAKVLLPEGQAIIEWPPPGLDRLAGVGWALTRVATWAAASVVALVWLLYLQPVAASGAWMSGERSWLWKALWAPALLLDGVLVRPVECSMRAGMGEACPAPEVDAAPLWLFALSALILALALAALRMLDLALTLRRELRAARRSGYPWTVLVAAAWDSGPSTGHLLNGSGPFALETEGDRHRWHRRRQLGDAWLIGGAAATALIPLLWLTGIVAVGDARTRWLTLPELLLCTLPLLVGIAARNALRRHERRAVVRWRRGTPSRSRAPSPPASLVQGWLEAGGAHLFPGRGSARPAVTRILVPLGGAALALAFALPVLFLTQVYSFFRSPTQRSWQNQWFEFVGNSQLNRMQWASIDSSLADEITRLGRAAPDRGRVVGPPESADAQLRARVRRFLLLDDSHYTALRNDTAWVWMRTARARADSIVAGARVRNLPINPENIVGAAVLAIEAGDVATARARVRDLMIRARFFLTRFPERGMDWGGFRAATNLHFAIAEHTGDTLGARVATDISTRFGQFGMAHRFFVFVPFSPSLMADPDAPPALAYVGDRRQAPGIRRLLATATVTGQCYNGREILFGPSPLRRTLIDSARALVADLPGAVAHVDSVAALTGSTTGAPGILGYPARFGNICIRIGGY